MSSNAAEMIFNDQETCVVIAEIGVNHDGDVEVAKSLALSAISCGADIVKFQIFDSDEEISSQAEMTDYQRNNTKLDVSQLQMAKSLELSLVEQRSLADFCIKNEIPYLYSVFDEKSLDFAISNLGADVIKVPSGDITNYPLLRKIARSGVDIIISSGCCFDHEIEDALGYVRSEMAAPDHQKIMLFQCISEYPAPFEESNLRTLSYFREKYNVPVGLSDHSDGIFVSTLAVASGARAIEKHFTYDKMANGPDHSASCDPKELTELCGKVRETLQIMGSRAKVPTLSEEKNRTLIRKSIVAKHNLTAGKKLSFDDLAFKRPGNGVPPTDFLYFVGKTLLNNKSKDEMFCKKDVC